MERHTECSEAFLPLPVNRSTKPGEVLHYVQYDILMLFDDFLQ